MKKYLEVENDIRNKILNREFSPGEQLPSEKILEIFYSTSKMTIKKAMDLLVSEGFIVKRRGSGTFVKQLSDDQIKMITSSNQLKGKTALYKGREVSSKILLFNLEFPNIEVSKTLQISQNTKVYHIERVRYIDNEPMVIEDMVMPEKTIPGLTEKISEGSIYSYIEDSLNLEIQSSHRNITVRKATEYESTILELEPLDPVVISKQVAYLSNGSCFEYSKSIHRFDEFSLDVILTKN